MSKNKDIDKHKEFKIEKLEKPELKEKPEKRELKEIKEPWKEKIEHKEVKELKQEIKEKPERKEFKEPIKEKVEHKEIKELEKTVLEKGGKEIAETVDPGDILTRGGGLGTEAFAETSGAPTMAAAKPKETDKATIKDFEKVQKDIEKLKPEKEFSKNELKDIKIEKLEHKEFKFEKHEIKDLKVEIFEKHHHKDFLPEKRVFENDPKGIVENPPGEFPGFDPATRGPLFKATGTAEERLAELEEAVTKLTHFIGVDLRPDLSEGALKGEPDTGGTKPNDEAKPDDKSKKPAR
jgi:hypothetical protein